MFERCYICGKPLRSECIRIAYLEDDDHAKVFIGSDCHARTVKAGESGIRSGKGRGPMVFSERQLAETFANARRESAKERDSAAIAKAR